MTQVVVTTRAIRRANCKATKRHHQQTNAHVSHGYYS